MELLGTSFFWVTLWQIIMINIVLSGDNAVVIAMASRALPPRQQSQAILFGSIGAIVLRIVLTFFAVVLLELPFLKIVGAALLIWIGIKMLIPEDDEAEIDAHAGMWAAIKTIIIADFVMSLDNVIGVAAAAKGNFVLLVLGLVISIPLIIYGSTLILKLMNRFSFIVTIGGGLLGWVAGEMLVSDPAISGWVGTAAPWAHTGGPIVATMMVVGTGMWMAARAAAQKAAPQFAYATVDPMTAATPQLTGASDGSAGLASTANITQALSSALDGNAITEDAPIRKHEVAGDHQGEEAPPGYRWVSSQWKTLPNGHRDYAALHGLTAYRHLAPMSSRSRSPTRRTVRPRKSKLR